MSGSKPTSTTRAIIPLEVTETSRSNLSMPHILTSDCRCSKPPNGDPRWYGPASFTYKGRAVDIKHVGQELGVRYVLEGSVRKTGSRIRITGNLIEAETGSHIWANRYDGLLDDIFDLQDQITQSIVGALQPKLNCSP